MTVVNPSPREVDFATSGQSGSPVTWYRTANSLRAEVDLIAETVIGPMDRVVSFAPPNHLYGYLYGRLLPELRRIAVRGLWSDPLGLPEVAGGERTLFVCLPSSWHVMSKLAGAAANLSGSFALHGTGPTTSVTQRALRALAGSGLRAAEIFGSTETGAIGYRLLSGEIGPAAPWRLLPDVELVPDPIDGDEHLLHVRSNRIARRWDAAAPAPTYRLTDLIRPVDGVGFEFVGRRSRLVKVNGRRCDLERVEDLVAASFPWLDVVCVPVQDPVRGEHYELFHSSPNPDEPTGADLASHLRCLLGALPVPRAVHEVPHIPRTLTGKIKIDQLFSLAASLSRGSG